MERFIPKKRTAPDGKVWWYVWDKKRNNWSSFIIHGVYYTKKECERNIYKYNSLFKEEK